MTLIQMTMMMTICLHVVQLGLQGVHSQQTATTLIPMMRMTVIDVLLGRLLKEVHRGLQRNHHNHRREVIRSQLILTQVQQTINFLGLVYPLPVPLHLAAS